MVHPGVLRRLKKKNPQNESERRLLWYSFVHFLARIAIHLPFREASLRRCNSKRKEGAGGDMKLKRWCSTWSPCDPDSRSSQHSTVIFSERFFVLPPWASAAVGGRGMTTRTFQRYASNRVTGAAVPNMRHAGCLLMSLQ
jgi:hypothetical protein